MYRKCSLILICLTFSLLGTATAALSGWQAAKEIIVSGESRYRAFFLDAEVYRHAGNDLADLRITDESGDFVPYYLQSVYTDSTQAETVYTSRLTDTFQKNNDTYQDFQLQPVQADTDIIGNILTFNVPSRDFVKKVEVYGSFDGLRWDYLLTDTIHYVGGLTKNKIALPGPLKYSYYRLKLLANHENIAVSELRLQHITSQIRTENYTQQLLIDHTIVHENRETVITLLNTDRLKISSLELDIAENHHRRYEIYADGRLLNSGDFYRREFQNVSLANTQAGFSRPVNAETITIVIQNRDDRPLAVGNVNITYLLDKVVFENTGSQAYTLRFGNPEAQKPAYDIEHFRKHIEGEPQAAAVLGPLQLSVTEPVTDPFPYHYVFNAVIGVISLFLVYFLARKLAQKPPEA